MLWEVEEYVVIPSGVDRRHWHVEYSRRALLTLSSDLVRRVLS